jgi:DNA-binding MarR family transcriptional regulator
MMTEFLRASQKLPFSAVKALYLIALSEMDRPTMGQFASAVGLSNTGATAVIDSLGAYVERHATTDRRAIVLTVTDRGDALVTKLRELI